MAGPIQYNFIAPSESLIYQTQDLQTALAALPGIVDLWRSNTESMTLVSTDRVSVWTGVVHDRQFTQTNAVRRPQWIPGDKVDFGLASAARGTMLLSGTQLGQLTSASIGVKIILDAGDETVDPQNVLGQDLDVTGTGMVRLSYRYTSSDNYVRLTVGPTSATYLNVDLPSDENEAMIWITISGGQVSLRVNGVISGSNIPSANLNLPTFALGGSREATPSLTGGIVGLCLSTAVFNDSQRQIAERAMNFADM